ncbi:hypothetical protein HPB52_001342 [Rhipicephalus sanguineus]|uniref:Uncharacterized protein n=1 Tax=Rhipicephalus sanguineus TaxID=34632 RepID=A0A9D4QCQ7_RHISA|nr:hypothetical protein HPB52_001342 [Rhipicephalus sanguineus]
MFSATRHRCQRLGYTLMLSYCCRQRLVQLNGAVRTSCPTSLSPEPKPTLHQLMQQRHSTVALKDGPPVFPPNLQFGRGMHRHQ